MKNKRQVERLVFILYRKGKKMIIKYKFENLNEIINKCRSNPYYANQVKQQETEIARLHFIGKEIKHFPLTIVFKWHMKSKIADLDNKLEKSILDGMVKAGTIPNDNVKYIKKIVHEYVEDKEDYVEIEFYSNNQKTEICTRNICNGCKFEMRCK
nr:MAG TPA: Endodeoxyribonuclease RusA [Caudoviricetes sp.]